MSRSAPTSGGTFSKFAPEFRPGPPDRYHHSVTSGGVLDAAMLRETMQVFAKALEAHRPSINALNVYPVPDGDTGTNMALTLGSVVEALDNLPRDGADQDMESVCGAISKGSLMGARGNSGVILSQLLRGLVADVDELDGFDGTQLAVSLTAAATAAYGAVGNPVEGTILTVARVAAETAVAADSADLLVTLDAARTGAAEALEQTPEMLQVLKDAGVVDAGGTGFVLFLDAMLNVVDGRAIPEPPEVAELDLTTISAAPAQNDAEKSIADLKYEVMFFLDAPDDSIDGFKNSWAEIGDSIVVVGGDGLWNCHVHCDDIGAAIEAGIEVGRPHGIRVTDLIEELEENAWVQEAMGQTSVPADGRTSAVVAVAVGDGVANIFRSLGVAKLVVGGQTMNPSTADLLAAVDAVAADEVVILPNNKNIIPVAEQVDAESSKTVRVLPTRSIAEGFASLLVYDPEADAESNVAGMSEAFEAVTAGEVTRAVRDSATDVGPVTTGDYIGIGPSGIRSIADSVVGATTELLDDLIDDTHEIVTLIVGVDAKEADVVAVEAWFEASHPDLEVETHDGGQPLYPFYVGIE